MYDNITKYNDHNHTPLSKVNIREAIDQVIREDQAETKDVIVDTFSPQRIYEFPTVISVNLMEPYPVSLSITGRYFC